jgi:hypothetical protein
VFCILSRYLSWSRQLSLRPHQGKPQHLEATLVLGIPIQVAAATRSRISLSQAHP